MKESGKPVRLSQSDDMATRLKKEKISIKSVWIRRTLLLADNGL